MPALSRNGLAASGSIQGSSGRIRLRRTKATLIYRRPLRDWSTPGQRPCLYRARNLLRLKRRPDPGLEQPQPRLQSESLEGFFEIIPRLSQVCPAIAMKRHDEGIGKCVGGLDCVVGVHREVEGAAGLR